MCRPNAQLLCFAAQVMSVLPLAAVHTLGNLLTNVSLGHVAVSFTHTIKARYATCALQRAVFASRVHGRHTTVPRKGAHNLALHSREKFLERCPASERCRNGLSNT